MEETPIKIYESISEVMKSLSASGISKENKNTQQHYLFRGIDDIYNALSKFLAENKVCIIPYVTDRRQEERTTKSGGIIYYAYVEVEYHLVSGIDGSRHIAKVVGEAMDTADKATNKAMSAAYKYLCLQLFCIPTKGDNDADGTTPEETVKMITEEQIDILKGLGVNPVKLIESLKVKKIGDLTFEQGEKAIEIKKSKMKEGE